MREKYSLPAIETDFKSCFMPVCTQYSTLLILDSTHCPGGTCNGDASIDISYGYIQFNSCYSNPPIPGSKITIHCLNGDNIEETYDQVTANPGTISCGNDASPFLVSLTLSPVPSSDCVVVDIIAGQNDVCDLSCN